ncbi:conserved hypothetical protein [Leishmania braziliensis MHOM/BR/75/M2904]|uniref:Uncharacterized protein n=2 Tax=Leishmania braziliensis TaxID=5660 RepID=A4HCB8_LEIBR|nr:conserved hypothetical protein [Leishmania braziliensis MHOM/BR/75/M2904]KAI5686146.1 hypothetical protein MNV84_03821 [Leishmania braziliensis]CAJ2472857.1 unnamed protein product [Leishmania braziliensis]CAM45135.1 conserved hypothetical protein [Leishmania braziliensis MHOM/BR/75/M2904]SYZ65910.1 hypothetical_protein [Leishmania braziliensis MHOM/BR/75/M2904]
MLSAMAKADGLEDPVESAGSAAAAAATTATPLARARAPIVNPHTNVEIQFTLPTTQEHVDVDDGEAFDFEDEADDSVMDILSKIVRSMKETDCHDDHEAFLERRGKAWYSLIFDNGDARQAATAIKAKISQLADDELRVMLDCLACAIIYYNTWGAVMHLGFQETATLRHLVLRIVLKMLVTHRCVPCVAEKYVVVLLKMLIVGWVSMKGILDTVELCLQHDELIHIGLRIIEHCFHKSRRVFELRTALAARPRFARRLAELYATEPRFELDVTLATRWWRGMPPTIYCSVPMENSQGDSLSSPVTCMAYFGVRDEIVTGDMSGAVTLWGPPGSSRHTSPKNPLGLTRVSVRPRGVVPLPMNCVPVAMAGQRLDGQYLAIAGMPLKSQRPYSKYCVRPAAGPSSTPISATTAMATTDSAVDTVGGAGDAAAGASNAGAIIVITCNENSIRWNKGEIVMRPPGISLTAITAFRNSIVAVGESAVSAGGPGASILSSNASAPHRLSFVDVMNGSVMRQIPKAHDDYITALTVLEDSSYVLLSGGRDAAMKMWDPRSREDTPVVNTALCTDALHHETTISSIHTVGYNIITADVYGAMVVWDLRNMAAPRKRHHFLYPIADVTLIRKNRAVVATTRGVVTVALDTLEPQDLYYEKPLCTRLLANDVGNLLFMARESELDVFAVSDL